MAHRTEIICDICKDIIDFSKLPTFKAEMNGVNVIFTINPGCVARTVYNNSPLDICENCLCKLTKAE